mmetsp:Transcript_7091/g.29276  ORF Transcript_7091/g.29276 Transcript_7091/m.29276 type:complete len:201 (-) Transcript_7091:803-1405(-)
MKTRRPRGRPARRPEASPRRPGRRRSRRAARRAANSEGKTDWSPSARPRRAGPCPSAGPPRPRARIGASPASRWWPTPPQARRHAPQPDARARSRRKPSISRSPPPSPRQLEQPRGAPQAWRVARPCAGPRAPSAAAARARARRARRSWRHLPARKRRGRVDVGGRSARRGRRLEGAAQRSKPIKTVRFLKTGCSYGMRF